MHRIDEALNVQSRIQQQFKDHNMKHIQILINLIERESLSDKSYKPVDFDIVYRTIKHSKDIDKGKSKSIT